MMTRFGRWAALASCVAMLIAPLSAIAGEVTFITDFGFNGRHAYFYVALDRGYYKAEGLDVKILRGQGSADAIKKVAAGAAQVGFADAGSLVLARSNDAIPVKLVSIVYASPPHAIFALAESGIKTAKDLEGRTVADSAFSAMPVIFNAYAQAAGIDKTKVKWISAESSALPALLATGRVDAIGQFTVGEPLLAAAAAPKALVRLAYKDPGLDYYGNGIIATEQTLRDNPDMVKGFVRATLKGMRDAFTDPAEAGTILNKYQKQISPEVAKGETELVRELAIVPGQTLGAIDPARIKSTIDVMARSYPLKTPVEPQDMYAPGFVNWTCESETPPAEAAAAQPPSLALAGIAKTYRHDGVETHALGPIDLVVAPGTFVSIVGPSGCGKSTLLRLVAGLEPASAGRLERDGAPLDGPSREVGIVFQDHVLFPWASVLDNVLLPAEVLGLPKAAARERARHLLAMTGLTDFADARPQRLSGGMKQRAAFCRALLPDPRMLLLDEPFGALDALTREELSLELSRLWQELGRTALLITHDIEEAILLGDRVLVMSPRPGRIRADIAVDLPRPRGVRTAEHPRFVAIKQAVRELIFARPGP